MRETPGSVVWLTRGPREEKLASFSQVLAAPSDLGELSGYALKHLVDEGKISSYSYRAQSDGSRCADANQRSDGKRLGSFPKKQILKRVQARFIIWCLTYDRIQQRASGSRYHSYGLLTRLAKRFGVTRECIVQIDKRRTWRGINRPKRKQLLFIERDPTVSPP
jgi:hypothetical protein